MFLDGCEVSPVWHMPTEDRGALSFWVWPSSLPVGMWQTDIQGAGPMRSTTTEGRAQGQCSPGPSTSCGVRLGPSSLETSRIGWVNHVSFSSRSLGLIAEQKRDTDDKKHVLNACYMPKHCFKYLTNELIYVKQLEQCLSKNPHNPWRFSYYPYFSNKKTSPENLPYLPKGTQ